MRTVALIAAVALGIAAAVGVASYVKNLDSKYRQEHQLVKVAVARRSLKAGGTLEPGTVTFTETPLSALTPQNIGEDAIERYYGQKVNRNIDKGTRILAGDFLSREVRPASRALTQGWRAIALGVDATTGVSGLIRPGDHVDIHATTTTTTAGRTGRGVPETWSVLSDVTVLAVDDRMSETLYGLHRGYSNLVLAVTPQEAQLLTYLKDYAKLTFTLRPRDELGQRKPVEKVDSGNVRQLAEEANAERQRRTSELEDRQSPR